MAAFSLTEYCVHVNLREVWVQICCCASSLFSANVSKLSESVIQYKYNMLISFPFRVKLVLKEQKGRKESLDSQYVLARLHVTKG